MPDRPKISVVIPTYNRAHTLPRAIDSVLAQSEQDFELLIVDDASADGTDDYLATRSDPRIRLFGTRSSAGEPQKLGVSGARNHGLTGGRADIVACLDSDDAYRKDYLAVTLAAFARDPNVVCTLASCISHLQSKRNETRLPDITLAPAAFEWALMCELIPVSASALAVRRADALAVGGFDSNLNAWEDREFLIRLAPRGSARLIPDIVWDKHLSPADGLSSKLGNYGPWLIDYLAACPAIRARYPKLASYFATRILVADLRHRLWPALRRDLRMFGEAGLLAGGPSKLWRNHREVQRYRRRIVRQEALASIADPPHRWG